MKCSLHFSARVRYVARARRLWRDDPEHYITLTPDRAELALQVTPRFWHAGCGTAAERLASVTHLITAIRYPSQSVSQTESVSQPEPGTEHKSLGFSLSGVDSLNGTGRLAAEAVTTAGKSRLS